MHALSASYLALAEAEVGVSKISGNPNWSCGWSNPTRTFLLHICTFLMPMVSDRSCQAVQSPANTCTCSHVCSVRKHKGVAHFVTSSKQIHAVGSTAFSQKDGMDVGCTHVMLGETLSHDGPADLPKHHSHTRWLKTHCTRKSSIGPAGSTFWSFSLQVCIQYPSFKVVPSELNSG